MLLITEQNDPNLSHSYYLSKEVNSKPNHKFRLKKVDKRNLQINGVLRKKRVLIYLNVCIEKKLKDKFVVFM